MKRTIIAIDIDDVIADSTEAIRLSVNKRYNVNLKPEHYQVEGDFWGYYERVWDMHNLSDRVNYQDESAEMAVDQSHIPLLPGALFAITELSKRFDIIFITARYTEWQEATAVWLDKNLSGLFKDLHFAGNSEHADKKTKGQQAKEVGASWLIDDNPEHCLTAIAEGVNTVLFGEYGWQHDAPQDLLRCRDWPAVLEYFDAVR